MHRLSIAAILLSTLALPGCIFAIGADKHHWHDGMTTSEDCGSCDSSDSSGNCESMQHMQAQLNLIEQHLKGQCKPDCPYCKPGATKDEAKPESKAETKPDAQAPAKPVKP